MSIQFPIEGILGNLKIEEGFRARAYRCSEGHLTLGYGRNIDAGGLGITEEEAEVLLRADVIRTIDELRRNYPWFDDLNKSAREVLVELCFQLGAPRLAKFKKMLAGLQAHDYDAAAAELLDSKFARQVPARANRLFQRLTENS